MKKRFDQFGWSPEGIEDECPIFKVDPCSYANTQELGEDGIWHPATPMKLGRWDRFVIWLYGLRH